MMPALFIGNIPYDATDHDLEALLLQNQFHPKSVRIILDRETNRSRGFGFVELVDPAECARAKTQLDGAFLLNRQIAIRDADSKPPRSGLPTNAPGKPQRTFTNRPPVGQGQNQSPPWNDARPPERENRRQARRNRERERDDW